MPSMTIRPEWASTNRKKLRARVLLPHPVAPTIPIFSLGFTEKEIPCSTLGRSGYTESIMAHDCRYSDTDGISDDKLLDRQSTLVGPTSGWSRLDELGCFLRNLGIPVRYQRFIDDAAS